MDNTKLYLIIFIIGMFFSNLVTSFTAVARGESNLKTAIEADRACRPGIYKRVLESDNRVICIGGSSEEWIVPLNK